MSRALQFLLLAAVALAFASCVAGMELEELDTNANELEVRERCGSCNYGTCKSQTLQVGACTHLCSACTNVCQDYYIVSNNTAGDYFLRYYDDAKCEEAGIAVQLVCDSCNVYDVRTCSAFYLKCGASDFWLWMLLFCVCVLLLSCAAAGIIGGIMYFKKRQNYQSLDESS